MERKTNPITVHAIINGIKFVCMILSPCINISLYYF